MLFSLSGPCELLFLLCLIAPLNLVVVSEMLCPCIVCIDLSIYLFVLCVACLTVFVQFAIFFSCLVVILLLNCMELLSVWGGGGCMLCWIDHEWSLKECVLCL